MGFDWMSFATGFLERTEEIRSTREEEAKQFEREQRELARRNAASISRRRAIVDQVTGYYNYLRNNGATDEQIQAAISSGPQAIEQFTTAVQAEVERNNGRPLGAEDVAALIRMPQGFTGIDMPMEEFIRQTYGLGTTPAATTEQRETSFLDRIGGGDLMARAEERLASTQFAEGMTIQQINDAAARGDYQSLMPGTFATFAADRSYSITEDGPEFMRNFNRIIDDTVASSSYNPMALAERGITSEADVLAEQQRLRIEAVDPIIRGYADQDAAGFLEAHDRQLRNQLGDEYVDRLRAEYGLDGEADEEPAPTGDDTDTATSIPEPSPIEVTPLPAIGEGGDTGGGDTGTQTEPASGTVVGSDGVTYTKEDWDNMTRTERERAGLPTSPAGAFLEFVLPNLLSTGDTTEQDLEGSALADVAPRPTAVPIPESEVQNLVDEATLGLLQSSGAAIVEAASSANVRTKEELRAFIEQYAAENNITLPADITSAVDLIFPNL